jgi:hypothetical protein
MYTAEKKIIRYKGAVISSSLTFSNSSENCKFSYITINYYIKFHGNNNND